MARLLLYLPSSNDFTYLGYSGERAGIAEFIPPAPAGEKTHQITLSLWFWRCNILEDEAQHDRWRSWAKELAGGARTRCTVAKPPAGLESGGDTRKTLTLGHVATAGPRRGFSICKLCKLASVLRLRLRCCCQISPGHEILQMKCLSAPKATNPVPAHC